MHAMTPFIMHIFIHLHFAFHDHGLTPIVYVHPDTYLQYHIILQSLGTVHKTKLIKHY